MEEDKRPPTDLEAPPSEEAKPARRHQFDWSEFALPVLAGLAIIISFFYQPEGLPGFTVCWFRALTGLPCPGCGLTRAFCAISHGDFAAAWKYNPFGLAFYLTAILLVFWPAIRRLFPSFAVKLTESRYAAFAAFAVVGVLWIFGLLRILFELE
jgi:Protein of unknown function (DUF2752)